MSRFSPESKQRIAAVAPLIGMLPVMALLVLQEPSWLTWVAAIMFVAGAAVASVALLRQVGRDR
jgi:hypothetical protein